MNKLLRNPWVVAALVVGMAALWWVEMGPLLFPATATVSAAPAPVPPSTSPEPVVSGDSVAPVEEAGSADSLAIEPIVEGPRRPTELRWERSPVRDPFGPVAVTAPVASTPVEAPPAPTPPPIETLPVVPMLEAVLSTPSAQIAVIDGHMVRVGDKVSGRPVLKIDASSVALGRGADASEPLLLRLPAR